MNKSYLTAITRKKPSRPMKWLEEHECLKGDILDYGCGRGFDVEYYGIDGYDPYFFPEYPSKQYNVITCNFVLNVVPGNERLDILDKIKSLLKLNGIAYLTVRRDIKREGVTCKGTQQWNVVLEFHVIFENNDFCIYRMNK